MRTMMLVLAALLLCIGCAAAAPVTFDMTVPLYNASLTAPCTAAVGDTCKDVSQAYIYRRAQGAPASDSLLVLTLNVAGLFGKPVTFTVEQPEGTYLYWTAVSDATGNRSCNSPLVSKAIVLTPAPPSLR